ncbi:hypothetical protein [Actinomadura sp. 6N118]|uniref:hypothetical protein n=1 Tax=Actinomadura sp. 6N118 TaxID=3375151 RepID=UPI00379AF5C0
MSYTTNVLVLEGRLERERRAEDIRRAHEQLCERATVQHTRALAELAAQRLQAELARRAVDEIAARVGDAGLGELLTAIGELTATVRRAISEAPPTFSEGVSA